ncbi:MAG TPA: DUF1707 domain-containing protein [Microlunatus sp.]|nr:DUF1707 domain-containing protein [Microlunatus sp.]
MSEPVPPPRIGDAERDQATEYLREHLAQGRITQAEFDERITAALQALTQPDLDKLFVDLPAPRPGQQPAVPGPAGAVATPTGPASSPRLRQVMGVVTAVAWPLTLLLLFAIGWHNWFLIFIPIAISAIWGHLQQQEDEQRKRLDRERRRQLEGRDGDQDG